MRMLYRCRSCGSNATADLSCDYCGAGARKQLRPEKISQHTEPFEYMAICTGLVVGISLVFA